MKYRVYRLKIGDVLTQQSKPIAFKVKNGGIVALRNATGATGILGKFCAQYKVRSCQYVDDLCAIICNKIFEV